MLGNNSGASSVVVTVRFVSVGRDRGASTDMSVVTRPKFGHWLYSDRVGGLFGSIARRQLAAQEM